MGVGLFPNEPSPLRLVTGVNIEISEEWEIGKIHRQPQSINQQPDDPNFFSFPDLNQMILQKKLRGLDGSPFVPERGRAMVVPGSSSRRYPARILHQGVARECWGSPPPVVP